MTAYISGWPAGAGQLGRGQEDHLWLAVQARQDACSLDAGQPIRIREIFTDFTCFALLSPFYLSKFDNSGYLTVCSPVWFPVFLMSFPYLQLSFLLRSLSAYHFCLLSAFCSLPGCMFTVLGCLSNDRALCSCLSVNLSQIPTPPPTPPPPELIPFCE